MLVTEPKSAAGRTKKIHHWRSEESSWELLGTYEVAVEDNAFVDWSLSDKYAVSYFLLVSRLPCILMPPTNSDFTQTDWATGLDRISPSLPPPSTTSSRSASLFSASRSVSRSATPSGLAPVTASTTSDELPSGLREELVIACEVPRQPSFLHVKGKADDVRISYARHVAAKNAIRVWKTKKEKGEWTVDTKITELDIGKVFFFGRSNFYDVGKLFKKLNPDIPQHAKMLQWLENGPGAPSDADIWGDIHMHGSSYSRVKLEQWLEATGERIEREKKRSHKKHKGP